MSRHHVVAAFAVASLLTTGAASASLMDSINALSPGDMYRVIFVTSTARDATSTNIGDYNTFVTNAATAGAVTGPLGLSWNALVSTAGVNARTNTGISSSDTTPVSLFNTNGDVIAASGQDLWDLTLTNPVLYTESLSALTGNDGQTWTGTEATGITSGASLGIDPALYGQADQTNPQWVQLSVDSFSAQKHFYGISEKVTIPTAVPEPSTVTLFGLALVVAAASRGRKFPLVVGFS